MHLQEPEAAKDTEPVKGSEPMTDAAPAGSSAAKDNATKGNAAYDSAVNDRVAKDNAANDSASNDSATKGNAAYDSAVNDSAAKDSPANDSAAKDSAAKDSPASDGMAKDSAANDGLADSAAKDSPANDSAATNGSATPKRTSRTGRNLPVAIAVGLGLGGLAIGTLFTVKSTFLIMMGAAVAVALWELDRALRPREIRLPLIPLYAGQAALWTCAYWLGYKAALAALGLALIALMGWRLHGTAAGYLRDVTASMFAVAYLPLPGMFVVLMLSEPDGARRTLLFLVLTVCSDTGGYFAGILFGKHPLVPLISPKKTWEGLAGSALACLVAGGVLLPVLLHGHAWQGLLLGAAVVAVATMGDLIESMIKRDLGIKDMGSLLPGHGGALDRIDAMLVAAPVTWLLLVVFVLH